VFLDPDDDEAHYHLGLALRGSDAEAALHHFQAACRLDPGPSNYSRELALTLWKLERFDDALAAARRSVAIDGTDEWTHNALGLIHEARGDFASAKQAHLQSAALLPDCGLFWASAARAAARLEQDGEADALFRRGLAAEMDSAVVCRYYGVYLEGRGKLSSARRHLQRAVTLDPEDDRSRRRLAAFEKKRR
jgi:tetratricopeptide (TPR) repeat protein